MNIENTSGIAEDAANNKAKKVFGIVCYAQNPKIFKRYPAAISSILSKIKTFAQLN